MSLRPYRTKRAVDLILLLLFAPFAIAISVVAAIVIKLDSPGPVLFRQERVGRDGRPFRILKFRTMNHAPEITSIFPDPARVTRVGRWLRRFSLDEIPQLWNVARGDMSIVGPRPTMAYQVERYSQRQLGRLAVRPGITGLAQVTGRSTPTWALRIEMDLDYVARQSPLLDGRMLVATIKAVTSARGIDQTRRDDPIAALPDDQGGRDGSALATLREPAQL